jgi:Leucine-rich repeat (LRR) protein
VYSETLPPSLAKLSKLQHIHLKYNQISSIDPSLGSLVELKELDLEGKLLLLNPLTIEEIDFHPFRTPFQT